RRQPARAARAVRPRARSPRRRRALNMPPEEEPAMAAWLFKTEPSTFSFADLVKQKKARWDGVKNATALKHLRAAEKGDVVVIYHTGNEKRAVGLAKVVRAPYPDPAAG